MLFFINLGLLFLTYGSGCSPCQCFNNLLICRGVEVQSFPTLSTTVKEQLKRIEIVSTRISCMPTIMENEYSNLTDFIEENNRIFNCTCLTSWFRYLPFNSNIKTNCSQDISTTSTPSLTNSHSPHTTGSLNYSHYPSTLSESSKYTLTVTMHTISPSTPTGILNVTTSTNILITHTGILNNTKYTNSPVTINPSTGVSAHGVILLSLISLGLLLLGILLIVYKLRGYYPSKVNWEREIELDRRDFEFINEDDCEVIFEQSESVV